MREVTRDEYQKAIVVDGATSSFDELEDRAVMQWRLNGDLIAKSEYFGGVATAKYYVAWPCFSESLNRASRAAFRYHKGEAFNVPNAEIPMGEPLAAEQSLFFHAFHYAARWMMKVDTARRRADGEMYDVAAEIVNREYLKDGAK